MQTKWGNCEFGLFHPLRNAIFTRLWIGQSLSRLGDSVMSVMLPLVLGKQLARTCPSEAYGRVASLDMFGSWALLPLGYLTTGFLAAQVGGIRTMVIQAAVILGMALFALTIRDIRSFN